MVPVSRFFVRTFQIVRLRVDCLCLFFRLPLSRVLPFPSENYSSSRVFYSRVTGCTEGRVSQCRFSFPFIFSGCSGHSADDTFVDFLLSLFALFGTSPARLLCLGHFYHIFWTFAQHEEVALEVFIFSCAVCAIMVCLMSIPLSHSSLSSLVPILGEILRSVSKAERLFMRRTLCRSSFSS